MVVPRSPHERWGRAGVSIQGRSQGRKECAPSHLGSQPLCEGPLSSSMSFLSVLNPRGRFGCVILKGLEWASFLAPIHLQVPRGSLLPPLRSPSVLHPSPWSGPRRRQCHVPFLSSQRQGIERTAEKASGRFDQLECEAQQAFRPHEPILTPLCKSHPLFHPRELGRYFLRVLELAARHVRLKDRNFPKVPVEEGQGQVSPDPSGRVACTAP